MVVLERSQAEVLAQPRRLLRRLLLGGGIAVALGMLVAPATAAVTERNRRRFNLRRDTQPPRAVKFLAWY